MATNDALQQAVLEDLARDLYDLHAARLGGKNFRGNPIAYYEELPSEARGWWVKGVDAALAPVARALIFETDYGPRTPPTP